MALKLLTLAYSEAIDLPVKVKTADGTKDNFLAGFKLYNIEEADKKLKELMAAMPKLNEWASDRPLTEDELLQNEEESATFAKYLTDLIKNEVLYLKNVRLNVLDDETGKKKVISIADTRQATKHEGLWDTPEECLDVLLSTYLQWSAYKSSFTNLYYVALGNKNYETEVLKN